jgi:hypothetical protein
MSEDEKRKLDPLLQVHLQEYSKLKDEQVMRIRFRDSTIPLTLASVAALVPFALAKEEYALALLLVPVISLIMGWLYLVNDEKVSHLGSYFRKDLHDELVRLLGPLGSPAVLGWELKHRSDSNRATRKNLQLMIDLVAFCLPGLLAIGLYVYFQWSVYQRWSLIVAAPFVLISVVTAILIWKFSDRSVGK